MAEVTSKTIEGAFQPQAAVKFFYVTGISAANNDTLTVSTLTTVRGCYLVSTTGTVITCTFATNVVTMTNSSTLTVSGLAWGT
jgi:hypothetical protein